MNDENDIIKKTKLIKTITECTKYICMTIELLNGFLSENKDIPGKDKKIIYEMVLKYEEITELIISLLDLMLERDMKEVYKDAEKP